jgi:glutamate-1-semialdehyde 2,1-aminomutase
MQRTLKERALEAMPGGVNSPVRAFRSVGRDPLFAKCARGPFLETEDGRVLIDYCLSFGPLILGHAPAPVVEAITRASQLGATFAVTTRAEIELAELIKSAFPSIERVRLVSSGTEACMTAIRLARGFTGRNRILKFSGCYHGHADCLLVKAGSGVAGVATASSAGVPEPCAANTLVARYNHPDDVAALVREHGHDLAAIIVEPVAANVGLVMPEPGFLESLRSLADACGALLVFDEVITGFRFCFGGWQNICGIRPDLTCLGKIIGGGLPVGAVGGRADVMERLAPLGDVYQAGTLSGNPVSVAAGLAVLRSLQSNPPYADLDTHARRLVEAISDIARAAGLKLQVPRCGSVFSLFFCERPPRHFVEVLATDANAYVRLFHRLLDAGVYLPPSPFEVSFLSTVHDDGVIEATVRAFARALAVR